MAKRRASRRDLVQRALEREQQALEKGREKLEDIERRKDELTERTGKQFRATIDCHKAALQELKEERNQVIGETKSLHPGAAQSLENSTAYSATIPDIAIFAMGNLHVSYTFIPKRQPQLEAATPTPSTDRPTDCERQEKVSFPTYVRQSRRCILHLAADIHTGTSTGATGEHGRDTCHCPRGVYRRHSLVWSRSCHHHPARQPSPLSEGASEGTAGQDTAYPVYRRGAQCQTSPGRLG